MDEASESRITVVKLQQDIPKRPGVISHHTCQKVHVQVQPDSKAAAMIHVNHADRKTVNSWKCRVKRRILRLKRERFTILTEDE